MSNASLELGGGKWGTKDGNLLGYASSTSSSKFVPREFTFTRGSDIAATRINSSGSIEKYRENLLTYSNDFSTWSKVELNSTLNQADPFGGNTATLITTTGTTFGWIRQQPTNTGVQTISFYVKAGSNTKFTAGLIQSPYPQTTFTLTGNGAKSSNAGVIDSTITSVGNGWYRCSMTYNITSTYEIRFYPNDTINKTIGDSVYIYGFQLEKGLVATSYLESGATTATSGVADNEPRIDYAGGTASLLLEPSRTNLITQSEYLESPFNSLLTFNSITSPEGLVNAVKIVENTNTNMHGIRKTSIFPTNASAVVYTISVFAKKNQRDFLQIQTYADSTSINSNGFDLTNGTITGDSTNHKIEDYGNGWYRCSFTVSITQSTGGYNFIRIAIGKVNSSFYYTGDNTSGLYLYGFQFEEGSYPTSYIPTYGTSVTRNWEQIVNTNISSIINTSNPYTIFFDFTRPNANYVSSWQIIGIDNGGYTSRLKIVQRANFDQFKVNVYDGTTNATSFSIDNSAQNKIAVVYDGSTSYKIFTNGTLFQTLSCGAINGTRLTSGENGTQKTIDNHQQISLFPTALSDAECIALTT